MKTRYYFRLFEHENRLVLLGVFICVGFAFFRIIRCDIVLEQFVIVDRISALIFLEGYIFDDIGLGFFDNAVFGINIFIPCILLNTFIENRYNSEKAYYFYRYGNKKYYIYNFIISLLLILGYECIQLLFFWGYLVLIRQYELGSVSCLTAASYMLSHYLCLYFHFLLIWQIWLLIKGYQKYLIALIILLVQTNIIAVLCDNKLFWCPISVISFDARDSGCVSVFLVWLLILCMVLASLIFRQKCYKDIL